MNKLERMKESNSIYKKKSNTSEKTKYLGVNLTKDVNNLYKQNYQPLKKNI
jgi:hypothetical protein